MVTKNSWEVDKLEIRNLTVEDIPGYWALRLKCLREEPDYFGTTYEEEKEISSEAVRSRFEDKWDFGDNFILGAFTGKTLVGYVRLMREPRVKLRHKGEIGGLYVIPAQRRRGIAETLLVGLIERAQAIGGIEQLNLTVESCNVKALYKKLGFTTFGLEKKALKQNGIYFDEEYMVKDLAR